MNEHQLGNEFEKADRAPINQLYVKKFLDGLPLSMTLKSPPEKDIADLITKGKKAHFVATLELPLLQIWLKAGSAKPILVGSKDLDGLRDNGKVRDILNKLADTTKLITRDAVWKWHDTHYDDQELSFFAGTIGEMERSQAKLQVRHDALKGYKFDKRDAPGLRAELHAFAAKHSWEHYLQFVEDIDQPKGDTLIFDTYVKDGAKLPVNLGAPLVKPIAAAIKGNMKADWAAARALIVKLIDTKFIPDMRKDELAEAAKELARLKTAIPEKKKAFVKAGGKL